MSMDKNNEQAQTKAQYSKAYDEWEGRVGAAKVQLRNWRLACIGSILVAILLLVAIVMVLASQKTYVYVAEVNPQDSVVNLQALNSAVVPTAAQEAAIVGRFINDIMSLPLDPVVARNNWLEAYGLVAGQAQTQLTNYAQNNPPFAELGSLTQSVSIKNFNVVGSHSYEFTWVQTTYNSNGAVQSQKLYNGIFTVVNTGTPVTTRDILNNPLGIKIAYFNFKVEG